MVYLDTSVLLAHLLAEDRAPPAELWDETLVASRLTAYEGWVRLNARRLTESHGDAMRALLDRIAFLELLAPVLERARRPFPRAVRTLDALHLASMTFLQDQGVRIRLASYDERMREAAYGLDIPSYPA